MAPPPPPPRTITAINAVLKILKGMSIIICRECGKLWLSQVLQRHWRQHNAIKEQYVDGSISPKRLSGEPIGPYNSCQFSNI